MGKPSHTGESWPSLGKKVGQASTLIMPCLLTLLPRITILPMALPHYPSIFPFRDTFFFFYQTLGMLFWGLISPRLSGAYVGTLIHIILLPESLAIESMSLKFVLSLIMLCISWTTSFFWFFHPYMNISAYQNGQLT